MGKSKGEIAKGKAEGEGLKEFWSKMPYVIVLIVIVVAGIILVAQPKFLFGGGS